MKCRTLVGALLVATVVVVLGEPAHAQPWVGSGPPGADITALAADRNIAGRLYAGTAFDGIFTSTDSGATWTAANTGLTNATIFGIAVDPTSAGIAYAATNGGVFKTTDAGVTWVRKDVGLAATGITAIAVDPSTPLNVYAGRSANAGGGVVYSANGGDSWTVINGAGIDTSRTVRTLAIDPSDGAVYAGTAGKGVFKTPNSGASWAKLSTGLANNFIMALATHPAKALVIYAGTLGGGVFVNTNGGGGSWSDVSNGIGNKRIGALVIDPNAPGAGPDTIYAGTLGGGVFRSIDSSNTWTEVNTGFVGSNVTAITFDSADGTTVHAGTTGAGVFTLSGSNWAAASAGFPGARISSIAVDPTDPSRVLASTVGAGVFTSTDGTVTWNATSNGFQTFRVGNLTIDPVDPNQVFATSGEIYGSSDGGASWTILTTDVRGATALAIDPVGGQILYAGTVTTGVFRSGDGGASWASASGNLTRAQVSALAIDPANPATVYAGTDTGGISKTTDSGATWNASGLPTATITALAVAPSAPSTIYAATRIDGVFRSLDGGSSWNPASTGLASGDVLSLTVHPTDANTIYAGTPFDGVFMSLNGGTTWTALNDGLPTLDVTALATSPGSGVATYAGTRGVFVRSNACGASECGPCEQCDLATDTCVGAPRTSCLRPLVAGRSQLQIRRGRRATSNSVAWTWQKGPALDVLDFGDPRVAADYTLCVFDRSGTNPIAVFSAAAPAGGTCGRRDCWKGRGRPKGARGFKYSNRDRTPDGLASIDLKPGVEGRGRITVKGRGSNLVLPTLPTNVPLLGQVWAQGHGCWETEILSGGVKRNDEKQLRGKAGIP